jgi:hypothetical protein
MVVEFDQNQEEELLTMTSSRAEKKGNAARPPARHVTKNFYAIFDPGSDEEEEAEGDDDGEEEAEGDDDGGEEREEWGDESGTDFDPEYMTVDSREYEEGEEESDDGKDDDAFMERLAGMSEFQESEGLMENEAVLKPLF